MKIFPLIIFTLILQSKMSIAQIKYTNRNYPDNYIDQYGRKQGTWYIFDVNKKLINKIIFKNNVPDSTVYYDIKGNEIPLQKPEIEAIPINVDKALDPFNNIRYSAELFNCGVTVSCLINFDGLVKEYRLISSCSKKVHKEVLQFIKSLEFKPAQLKGGNILSQRTFYYGKSF